jgi:hypothetical protein
LEAVVMGRLRKCFCEVPREELLRTCREKFGGGRSTVELMSACTTAEEQDCVSAAALLGIGEEFFRELLADQPECLDHVLGCRRQLLSTLAREGIVVQTAEASGVECPPRG